MIDIRKIVEQKHAYQASIEARNMDLSIDDLDRLYEIRNSSQLELEALQKRRNETAKRLGSQLEREERERLVEEGKELKQKIASAEEKYRAAAADLGAYAEKIPNLHHPNIPVGKEEKDSLVLKTVGSPPKFNFPIKDHVTLGRELGIIDFDSATEISGTRFYYLKNEAVLLELALLRFGIDLLQSRGFSIFQTPDIAKLSVISKLGFQSRGPESNIYTLENEETGLIGTAEITLGAYYMNSVLKKEELPIKIAGISHCFRKEAGAAGQYSKGLYRVHQFTKLEMFIFCHPEKSEAAHAELLEIEEEIYAKLEIPYRVVDTCTGDLGSPAYRKFDLEAWMPGRGDGGEYGEITSASNCTDYQSQRLNARIAEEERKKKRFVHTLNGTAIALSRCLVALLENKQQSNGSVLIPSVLQDYCGFSEIRNGIHS